MTRIFDATPCKLGEGPLWHPTRKQLFWFDILSRQLLTRAEGETRVWQFGRFVTAAGWVDENTLLIASQGALFCFDIDTGQRQEICKLEPDMPTNRPNDGRADPWGGFWIGTMGIEQEPGAGAIYRYYKGELRRILPGITIPNAISFDPEGTFACYCDSTEHVIRKIRLNAADGWPAGESEVFIDMRGEDWAPDGAVIDTDGTLWNAQYGAARVAAYDRSGAFLRAVPVQAELTTCPAFGGEALDTLFVTSARDGLPEDRLAAHPENGMCFAAEGIAIGQQEHRVLL
ncbi:SMP-30/gluconolactonase/LRE family protein [Tropicimonas isoalkanivorans]|uniref:Sugar lactone lactonase YvrE n=1 Tax=Tropicimonas isoalkanivorans TaxID=441112 RepID=A0A1I1NE09_9RHOB|nr:SMP-30/gluconolactonase/LRE family protein [Tropicimonas isoalkanivorans]SFC95859.1 Sugar lactone lactonase YvrE [Tropicimonas isoalkanivorans]